MQALQLISSSECLNILYGTCEAVAHYFHEWHFSFFKQ